MPTTILITRDTLWSRQPTSKDISSKDATGAILRRQWWNTDRTSVDIKHFLGGHTYFKPLFSASKILFFFNQWRCWILVAEHTILLINEFFGTHSHIIWRPWENKTVKLKQTVAKVLSDTSLWIHAFKWSLIKAEVGKFYSSLCSVCSPKSPEDPE